MWPRVTRAESSQSQVNRREASCQSRATWPILVCNYKIHISDTDVPSSHTSLVMLNTDSCLAVFVIGQARYHYFHHSYCYKQSPESLLTSDNGLCNLQLDCRIRNNRQSPPGQTNQIPWFSCLSNEFSSAELPWALLDSNPGDCSTLNGTLPLSAELKQNISVKLLRIVCSKCCNSK